MSNTAPRRFRPEADEMFTFETEDFVMNTAHGLMYASFQDCVKAIGTIGSVLLSKFKEFVTTVGNCKSVSFERRTGALSIELKNVFGGVTVLYVEPTWYHHTLNTMDACKEGVADLTFVPGSFTEAVSCFVEIVCKNEAFEEEMNLCRSISLPDDEEIRLTPEKAPAYLGHHSAMPHLTPWCRVMWAALSSGISIEQLHYFAFISHQVHQKIIQKPWEKWSYTQHPSLGQ